MVALFLAACGSFQQTPTPVPPTPTAAPTPVPPTQTAAPIATPKDSLNPAPRGYHSMAYDSESKRLILYGGQTGNIFSDPSATNGETWAYDVAANKWIQVRPPSGPTPRGAAELAYDAESDRFILYGGANPDAWGLPDTWAYDYNIDTWTRQADGPDERLGARIVYDSESDRVILFGGYSMSGTYSNETWVYDFNTNTWMQMQPSLSPEARNFHCMAYDSKADRTVVLGGDVVGPFYEPLWVYNYNANTWKEVKYDNGPEASYYCGFVYDEKADRFIMFGGHDAGNNETWTYDLNSNTWQEMQPAQKPPPLSRHTLVYDTATDRVILFGGQVGDTQFKYSGETWVYDLNTNTWTNVTPHP